MSVDSIYEDAQKMMEKAVGAVGREFMSLRTGKASAALLDGIKVDYYGSQVPINQLATVSIPEPRMMVIQPWDKKSIGEIEKAIFKSDLGITPASDGQMIRLVIPEPTEERRKELVKVVRKKAEEGKVSIRSVRREANESIKSLEKKGQLSEDDSRAAQDKIQKLTDKYTSKIEELQKNKEKELLTI
jgi:ribosome recycling factor